MNIINSKIVFINLLKHFSPFSLFLHIFFDFTLFSFFFCLFLMTNSKSIGRSRLDLNTLDLKGELVSLWMYKN